MTKKELETELAQARATIKALREELQVVRSDRCIEADVSDWSALRIALDGHVSKGADYEDLVTVATEQLYHRAQTIATIPEALWELDIPEDLDLGEIQDGIDLARDLSPVGGLAGIESDLWRRGIRGDLADLLDGAASS